MYPFGMLHAVPLTVFAEPSLAQVGSQQFESVGCAAILYISR